MKHFITGSTAFVLLATAFCAAASAATLTVTVKLPNGAPAKHAFVRMWKMGASYAIVSLESGTTNAAGRATFNMRPGACLKAEYGSDSGGRPIFIGNTCPKPGQTTAAIDLSK
jgi:hypothetical protein